MVDDRVYIMILMISGPRGWGCAPGHHVDWICQQVWRVRVSIRFPHAISIRIYLCVISTQHIWSSCMLHVASGM